MRSNAQSSTCRFAAVGGVKRLERVNCWTSESCARKPCPRNSAPIEDVATPWPHYSLSEWWFCCKIRTLWDLALHGSDLKSITQSMIRPQNANAFPNELHTPPETTMYLTPCEMAHWAVLEMLAVSVAEKAKEKTGRRRKEKQGETQKFKRLFHLGSECCTGWRWWRNMLRHFIKFILSHPKIVETLQLIFTPKQQHRSKPEKNQNERQCPFWSACLQSCAIHMVAGHHPRIAAWKPWLCPATTVIVIHRARK